MKKLISCFVLVGFTASLSGCSGTEQGVGIGVVSGSLLGAVLGRGVGGAVAGAAIGGVLGGVLGNALSKKDKQILRRDTDYSLDSGQSVQWQGERARGFISSGQAYQNSRGFYCREYTQKIIIDGKEQVIFGRACRVDRNPDGSGVWVDEKKINEHSGYAPMRNY
jgi:surface antigen